MVLLELVSELNRVMKSKIFGVRYPFSVTFMMTHRCNNECDYCLVRRNKKDEIETEEVKRMIEQFSKHGTKRFGFSGGEPLLRDDIVQLVRYAKEKGLLTSICSNGKLLDKKKKVMKYVDVLQLSLEGSKELHEEIRKGSKYDEVLESIDIAKEYNVQPLVNVVLNSRSINDIDKLFRLSNEKEFLLSFTPLSKASADHRLFPKKSEIRYAVDKILRYKKKGYKVVNSYNLLHHIGDNWPDYDNCEFCVAGDLFCIVDSNGDVYPCMPRHDYEPCNGLEDGFDNCFDNLETRSFGGCWCTSFLELSLITNFSLESLYSSLKNFKVRRFLNKNN